MCEHVETAQGVPLTVTGVAQCKIMTDKELLRTASEQFLGKTSQEVQLTILQTLEGHLRAILGTLSVEEVHNCCCCCSFQGFPSSLFSFQIPAVLAV